MPSMLGRRGCVTVLVLCAAIATTYATQAWGQGACETDERLSRQFFVATNGSDQNAGTSFSPLRTIQKGIDCLRVAGDRLTIFGGRYTEFVVVRHKDGTPGNPIIIEGNPEGPVVTLQGSITSLGPSSEQEFRFHATPNLEWVPATDPGAHKDEYVSTKPLAKPPDDRTWFVNRGAFARTVNGRYTRLITYHRLEDLRADNETFEQIANRQDPRAGPYELERCKEPEQDPACVILDSKGDKYKK